MSISNFFSGYKPFKNVVESTPVDSMLMGIYYFKFNGDIVYIGISNNLGSRLRKHWNGASCSNLKEYRDSLYVKIKTYGDATHLDSQERASIRNKLEVTESLLIKKHNPEWNIRKKGSHLGSLLDNLIQLFK